MPIAADQHRDSPNMSDVQEGPVTVVVRHQVRPSKMTEFEAWLRGITQSLLKSPGTLGYNVLRPTDLAQPEYVVFYRFDTFAHLEVWENSAERLQWLEKLAPLSINPALRERHTGMEVWFALPPGRRAPPRWKMVLVTLLAIYPLVLASQFLLAPYVADWHIALRTLVISGLLVCVMTYFQMPLVTQLFSRWLYRPAGS
jgi:antibiotic biosynthesis monooxygenase (ABM) superfamily enzyme